MLTKALIRRKLAEGYSSPPFTIGLAKGDRYLSRDSEVDAILSFNFEGEDFEFQSLFLTRGNPKSVADGARQLLAVTSPKSERALLVAPYLTENQLLELNYQGLSAVDFSGNVLINIPGRMFVCRTGKPNNYRESSPTKYAYRGTTSIVARVFLCRSTFVSQRDIDAEIALRGGKVAVSTISKALKRLESDLIVVREKEELRLRQPQKLLDMLATSYQPPKVRRSIKLAITDSGEMDFRSLVSQISSKTSWVLSGASSIGQYAVMGRSDPPVVYVAELDKALEALAVSVTEASRFEDFELAETDDCTVYFDVRTEDNLRFASPIQTYLELSAGDKREQEVAQQVKRWITDQMVANG